MIYFELYIMPSGNTYFLFKQVDSFLYYNFNSMCVYNIYVQNMYGLCDSVDFF
jgi:hypothetical protein